MPDKQNQKFFYGYIIVVVSLLMLFVMHGISSSWGIFLSSLEGEFGWSRAAISGAHSMGFLLGGIFSILLGSVSDRLGSRMIMTVGGIVFALGCFLMSRVTAMWQVYLFYGVLVSLWGSPANVSLLSTTMRWFTSKRGLMSGIVKVGTGLGIMIIPVFSSHLISNYGWRTTFVILSFICLAVVVPLAQLLRRDPSQKGLKPYGESTERAAALKPGDTGFSPQQAFRIRQFWIVCAAFFIMWYCGNGLLVHLAPHAIDIGIPATQAARLISIIGGASIIGRLVIGVAGDRAGNRWVLTLCFIIVVASMSWLLLSVQLWQLYLFAAVYGFAHGGFFSLISPLIAELFGTRSHGTLFGIASFFGMSGGAVGPLVAGRIFDVAGNYQLAFLLIIGFSAAGFILSLMLKPVKEL